MNEIGMAEMTVSAERKETSTGTKLMAAAVAVLGIVLVVLTAMVWSESRRQDVVDRTETAAVADPSHMAAYALTLSAFLKERCGDTRTDALAAASAAEMANDPAAYEQAVSEAAERAKTITTGKSCDYVISEIQSAESRATKPAQH
jgi:Flp pilus assembly protein TadB